MENVHSAHILLGYKCLKQMSLHIVAPCWHRQTLKTCSPWVLNVFWSQPIRLTLVIFARCLPLLRSMYQDFWPSVCVVSF